MNINNSTTKPFLRTTMDSKSSTFFYMSWGRYLYDGEVILSDSWDISDNLTEISTHSGLTIVSCDERFEKSNRILVSTSVERGLGEIKNTIVTNYRTLNRGFKFLIGDM